MTDDMDLHRITTTRFYDDEPGVRQEYHGAFNPPRIHERWEVCRWRLVMDDLDVPTSSSYVSFEGRDLRADGKPDRRQSVGYISVWNDAQLIADVREFVEAHRI